MYSIILSRILRTQDRHLFHNDNNKCCESKKYKQIFINMDFLNNIRIYLSSFVRSTILSDMSTEKNHKLDSLVNAQAFE